MGGIPGLYTPYIPTMGGIPGLYTLYTHHGKHTWAIPLLLIHCSERHNEAKSGLCSPYKERDNEAKSGPPSFGEKRENDAQSDPPSFGERERNLCAESLLLSHGLLKTGLYPRISSLAGLFPFHCWAPPCGAGLSVAGLWLVYSQFSPLG